MLRGEGEKGGGAMTMEEKGRRGESKNSAEVDPQMVEKPVKGVQDTKFCVLLRSAGLICGLNKP